MNFFEHKTSIGCVHNRETYRPGLKAVPTVVRFKPASWDTRQTITVLSEEDDIYAFNADPILITHSSASDDAAYIFGAISCERKHY